MKHYTRFGVQRGDRCILCGLCVGVCDELVGARAISNAARGIDRKISTPFNDPTDACIGCGSCTYICPTGCIEMVEEGEKMTLKMTGHSLMDCPNDYQCTNCETDDEFVMEIKKYISAFRRGSLVQ